MQALINVRMVMIMECVTDVSLIGVQDESGCHCTSQNKYNYILYLSLV